MASSSQKNHAYLYTNDMKVTSIAQHNRCHNHVVAHVCHVVAFNFHAILHLALHMIMVGIDLGAIMLLLMRLGRHQVDQL
jgi:hypothetical protein